MACIAPGLDHPARGAVETAVADDGQAGIGGNVAARLIQRQPRNIAKYTVQNPAVGHRHNSGAESPGQKFFKKGDIALIMLAVAFTAGQDIIRVNSLSWS